MTKKYKWDHLNQRYESPPPWWIKVLGILWIVIAILYAPSWMW